MTERINLDDLDVGDDEEEADAPNRGDWLWRGEGNPEDEPPQTTGPAVEPSTGESAEAETTDSEPTSREPDPASQPAPNVPDSTRKKPVGIPANSGGAGAGIVDDAGEQPAEPRPAGSAAEGPHGGGIDDMTVAFTYKAVQRFTNPAAVFADAYTWSDWIGIIGNVETYAITKFQRTHTVDADFFTGSGTTPSERLQEIDQTSMFYAERMVVIGVDESDEAVAEDADWEFIPLELAADKAGWELKS